MRAHGQKTYAWWVVTLSNKMSSRDLQVPPDSLPVASSLTIHHSTHPAEIIHHLRASFSPGQMTFDKQFRDSLPVCTLPESFGRTIRSSLPALMPPAMVLFFLVSMPVVILLLKGVGTVRHGSISLRGIACLQALAVFAFKQFQRLRRESSRQVVYMICHILLAAHCFGKGFPGHACSHFPSNTHPSVTIRLLECI